MYTKYIILSEPKSFYQISALTKYNNYIICTHLYYTELVQVGGFESPFLFFLYTPNCKN